MSMSKPSYPDDEGFAFRSKSFYQSPKDKGLRITLDKVSKQTNKHSISTINKLITNQLTNDTNIEILT